MLTHRLLWLWVLKCVCKYFGNWIDNTIRPVQRCHWVDALHSQGLKNILLMFSVNNFIHMVIADIFYSSLKCISLQLLLFEVHYECHQFKYVNIVFITLFWLLLYLKAEKLGMGWIFFNLKETLLNKFVVIIMLYTLSNISLLVDPELSVFFVVFFSNVTYSN